MQPPEKTHSLWAALEEVAANLRSNRLADVFRFISFYPSERYGPHTHQRIEINYVKKGTCLLHLENECIPFRKGEIMIILPQVSHTFEAGAGGTTLMQLEFLPEIFSSLDNSNAAGKISSIVDAIQGHRLIKIVGDRMLMRVVQRIIYELRSKEYYYNYLVVMHYAELLTLIYRYIQNFYPAPCTNESLKKALAYIHHHYHTPLTVKEISRHVNISERYLRKLFSTHLHRSPLEYLNSLRIDKAVELLGNTEMSVKEISFACGFASPPYFSRLFKRQTGKSPGKKMK